MIKLDIKRLTAPTEPYWLDLPQGVRMKVRPLDGPRVAAAQAAAAGALAQIQTTINGRTDAGMPVDDLPDLSDGPLREGVLMGLFARALARYGAVEWSGVCDMIGDDLPFSRDGAEALVTDLRMMRPFIDKYFEPISEIHTEGNVSAPLPNLSSEMGADTARDVLN